MSRWKIIPGTGTYTAFDGHVVMVLDERMVEVEDRLLAELIEAARKVVRLRDGRPWMVLDESGEDWYDRVGELERALAALSESVGRQVEVEKKE